MEPSTLLDLASESAHCTGGICSDDEDRGIDLDDITLAEIDEAIQEVQQQQREQMMQEEQQPPPIRPGGGNTGAKGVLADYAQAKERARLRRQARAEALRLQMREKTLTIKPSERKGSDEEEEESDDDDDDKRPKELDPDDEDFIRLYREKRMLELQASQRKTFGFLKSITAHEFSDEIDAEVDSGAYVVIHLYKNYLAMSVRMNYVLQKFAQRFPYVKFMKIISTEADPNYDDATLPTLLIYRNGDLVKSLILVTDELPSGWDQDDVESLLRKHGVLPARRNTLSASGSIQLADQ